MAQELKSLRARVETLENLTSELQLIPTPAISEETESDDEVADVGHGFHTLKIIKDICDRELSEGRHSPVDLVTTDDDETLSHDVVCDNDHLIRNTGRILQLNCSLRPPEHSQITNSKSTIIWKKSK